MAQGMVNFCINEDVKKSIERARREMELSLTTAFTVFAAKAGKERWSPFEVTAERHYFRVVPAAATPRGGRAEAWGGGAYACGKTGMAGKSVHGDPAVAGCHSPRNPLLNRGDI